MTINLSGIVILAGGESSRMGSPKALLQLPNSETLLDFHIRHAKNLNVPVMVADNGKGFCQNKAVKIIDDYLPTDESGKGAGALSAITGAMGFLQSQSLVKANDFVLVVSCDSLLGVDDVLALFKKNPNNESLQSHPVIYAKGEKDFPLLGLYRVDLMNELTDYLDNGNRSVMKFLADKKVKTVDLPNDWGKLANFNTLDKFNIALKFSKITNF